MGSRLASRGACASGGVVMAVVLVGCGIYAWWGRTRAEGSAIENPAAVQTTLAAVGQTPPPAPAPSRPEGMQAIPGAKVLVDLIAREETWLSVSSDGKRVFTGVREHNQTNALEAKEFAKLSIGI